MWLYSEICFGGCNHDIVYFCITWFSSLYVVFKIREYIQAGTFWPLTIPVLVEGASEKDGQLQKPS